MKETKTFNSRTISNYLSSDTLVYALGGLGEVGKNMYCIQCNDEIIIIDCGILFPDEGMLGVDYVIPDFSYLVRNQNKIKALFITHGHEDHIGGIPYLLRVCNIPDIYGPKFAIALIQKKIDDARLNTSTKLHIVNRESRFTSDNFHVAFFDIIHSIPDCLGLAVQTPNGWVMSTGDFKFDLTPTGSNADYQVMAFMGQFGIDILMADSTNAAVSGFSISEKQVAKSILEIMKKTKNRLIIATFSSNVNRMQQIISAANKCNRKICIVGRSMENVVNIGREIGHIKAKDEDFILESELDYYPPEKLCILCTGSQGEPMAALSRMANGSHKTVKIIPGDTVVFSSNPIPGNEVSVKSTINQLTRMGATVLTNSSLNDLHTTGHASQDEQKLMLQLVKPKYFMPMHGEYKMLKMHANTATETGMDPENIFVCANGDILVLRDHECYLCNRRIPTDDVYVEGGDVSGIAAGVLKDRKTLADNGLVSVVVCIDTKTNTIMCKPSIISRGFIFIKEGQTLIKEAENLVLDVIKRKMAQKTTFGDLKISIKEALESFLYIKTNRKPIIIPVILNNIDATEFMK